MNKKVLKRTICNAPLFYTIITEILSTVKQVYFKPERLVNKL